MSSPDRARAKQQLREEMRRVRAAIPSAERSERAARAEARLLALPEVRRARAALLFYSFGSEIPTAVLIRRLLARGCRVLLPYLDEEGMKAAEIRPGEVLEDTEYGPKEPGRRVAVDPEAVDVVVTPGLAFDRRGHRLGYGGGHYDRYLERLHPEAARIGIGFSSQIVDEVPAEDGDERVDLIVTDEGVVRARDGD